MKMVKKILLWTLVAFVIYAIFRYPSLAADAFTSVGSGLTSTFVSVTASCTSTCWQMRT
jgi:hypothetical protein